MGEANIFDINEDVQLRPTLWNELVKFRANYECEKCGYEQPQELALEDRRNMGIHAHHLDGNHENNCLSNGQALCQPCHASISAKEKHEAGSFGRASWKDQVECEFCGKLIREGMLENHMKARHKAAAKELYMNLEVSN